MSDVAMPRLSDSMEEGTILKWLKSDGDEVSQGEELVEIETDKANMTYEADAAGTLTIVASEGDTLAVGATIARIGEGAPPAPKEEQAEPEAPAEAVPSGSGRLGSVDGSPSHASRLVRTPATSSCVRRRKMKCRMNQDLACEKSHRRGAESGPRELVVARPGTGLPHSVPRRDAISALSRRFKLAT